MPNYRAKTLSCLLVKDYIRLCLLEMPSLRLMAVPRTTPFTEGYHICCLIAISTMILRMS